MKHTIYFNGDVGIKDTFTIAGPKEGEGPLANYFHNVLRDDILGQKSHEKAEILMMKSAIKNILNRTDYTTEDIDCVFAGDLLDEITSSNFAMREFPIPFIGLFNACATFCSALIMGAIMITGGYAKRVICATSSHFGTVERQYRYPLELGAQRTPLNQWTVTGAGCTLLEGGEDHRVKLTAATIGKVVDYGVTDSNDMGAAMTPAAMDTLITHFTETGRKPSYYDAIYTGDLGHAGSRLLKKLMLKEGYDLEGIYDDCGALIFNREAQKVGQGGSGTGCSNLVFNSYIYSQMMSGRLKRVLFVPTGALLSRITPLQGESIPGIAHAVALEVK